MYIFFLYQGISKAGVTVDYKIDKKMTDEIRELSHAGQVMHGLDNHDKEYGFYSKRGGKLLEVLKDNLNTLFSLKKHPCFFVDNTLWGRSKSSATEI